MNHDQISELYEMAAEWAGEKYSKKETGYTREYWLAYKIAELIMQECCRIVHDNTDDSVRVVLAIETHFGVE